jgi:hypothetical protein
VKIEGVESIYWVRKGLGMEAVALKFKTVERQTAEFVFLAVIKRA